MRRRSKGANEDSDHEDDNRMLSDSCASSSVFRACLNCPEWLLEA